MEITPGVRQSGGAEFQPSLLFDGQESPILARGPRNMLRCYCSARSGILPHGLAAPAPHRGAKDDSGQAERFRRNERRYRRTSGCGLSRPMQYLGFQGPFGDDFLEPVALRRADYRRALAPSLRRRAVGGGLGPIYSRAIARKLRMRTAAEQPLNT